MAQVHWLDYAFIVYRHDSDWLEVPGLYVFAGLVSDPQGTRRWRPFYVGRTQNFADRLPTHEYWLAAVRLGGTHVHALVEENAQWRAAIERQLIQMFQPPLNARLK